MKEHGFEEHGQPGKGRSGPKGNKATEKSATGATDEVPSSEEEIKPGLNQDISTDGQFSSEPPEEAGGSAAQR